MRSNALKAGFRIRLNDGREAVVNDNMKGNLRMVLIDGEIGSVYSHEIVAVNIGDEWFPVMHTPFQEKLKRNLARLNL